MRFSQRIGITPAAKLVQRESIDEDLRSSLWSLLSIFYWDTYQAPRNLTYSRDYVRGSNLESIVVSLWLHYFKKPTDTIDTFWEPCYAKLRKYFFDSKWHEAYDFIEFVAAYGGEQTGEKFVETANSCLERENSAYRFVGGNITEITSAEEITEVEKALDASNRFSGVKTHLTAALALLSDRKSPNYRNSIKESISAVESLAKQIAKDKTSTLGAVLKELEKRRAIHPALKSAFSSLYGYTSDADGIRHALLEEDNLSKADARFMLICCSAFINYTLDTTRAV